MFEDVQRQIDQTIRELEAKAGNGDPEAQSDLFVFLNAKAMEEYDQSIFDRAETMLEKSAVAGWPEAIEQMKVQSIRRRAFKRRLQRNEKP